MSDFTKMNPTAFTILAIIVGFLLIDHLSANAQNSLGNFLMLVGQVLETSANQIIYLQGLESQNSSSSSSNTSGTNDQSELQSQMAQLRQELDALKAMLGKPPTNA